MVLGVKSPRWMLVVWVVHGGLYVVLAGIKQKDAIITIVQNALAEVLSILNLVMIR